MATISLKPEVLRHVVDVHCHPTDAGDIAPDSIERLEITICAMSSHKADQSRVAALAEGQPKKVIPCFGTIYSSKHRTEALNMRNRIPPVVLSLYFSGHFSIEGGALSHIVLARNSTIETRGVLADIRQALTHAS